MEASGSDDHCITFGVERGSRKLRPLFGNLLLVCFCVMMRGLACSTEILQILLACQNRRNKRNQAKNSRDQDLFKFVKSSSRLGRLQYKVHSASTTV